MFRAPGLPPSPGGGVSGSSGFWSSAMGFWLLALGNPALPCQSFLQQNRALACAGEIPLTYCIYRSLVNHWMATIITCGKANLRDSALPIQVLWRSIISHAQAALARERPAQINVTRRKAERNASLIECLISAAVCGSRPAGTSRAPSRLRFDSRLLRASFEIDC